MQTTRPHTTRSALLYVTLLTLTLGCTLTSARAQQKSEMTLAEFRAAVAERLAQAKPPANLKRGEKPPVDTQSEKSVDRAVEAFTRLLSAQARKAAARQSQDRLAGWRKAAEARLQAQNTTALDADQLRFAETQASGSVARFEAARLRAQGEANLLLGRPASSPLVAEMAHVTGAASGEQPNKPDAPAAAPGAAALSAALPEPAPDLASRLAFYEKHLLPAGADLLAKMYESYLFGGVPLSSLLWQERELTRIETEYRLLHVQAEIEFAKAGDARRE